jgi:hypothetical protein
MQTSAKLLNFFRGEFQAEERSGFRRLSKVPSTYVIAELAHYQSLAEPDRLAFIDCAAHWAHACYGFVIGAPEFDHKQHPYYRQWAQSFGTHYASTRRSVPLLRATVQQHKIDVQKGIEGRIPVTDFEVASSILEHCVKAPQLRKQVRDTLRPHGYYRKDHFGYWCRRNGHQFCVHVSFGGARTDHQLLYGVARPELCAKPIFSFEGALGFVRGNAWDFIVEDNVADAVKLFADLVNYSYELPERIKAFVA